MLMVCALVLSATPVAFAATESQVSSVINDTAAYVYKTVKKPEVGSIGGEWAVLGLARSGYDVPDEYYQNYYETVVEYVKNCDGVLHKKKYTEYSRVIVALTSIGMDPTNVGGYDLTKALGDYEKTIWQGMNGPIWALIALDSGNYAIPTNPEAKTQATRDMYIQRILDCQLPDGGWSLFGGTSAANLKDDSDPDITGMALQALSKYTHREDVKKAVDEALDCMSKIQLDDGGFATDFSGGSETSESTAQMIVALAALGISTDDARFVKNGNTPVDAILKYYQKGNGFTHVEDGSGSNLMATEQAFYALVAFDRYIKGKNSLYSMSDAISFNNNGNATGNTSGIKVPAVTKPGQTFADVQGHKNQKAIEQLASRKIINGMNDTSFAPDKTMTRAQFATIVVQALGMEPQATNVFTDVKSDAWYAGYVGTAYSKGIVSGTTATKFNPEGTITREQAAAMVARAAKLCGMDTAYDTMAARDVLAGFGDYVKVSEYALAPLAFCYNEGILDDSEWEILPKTNIKRCEIAQMIYNMLGAAELI